MKKIWITGAEGHIGTALLDLLEGVEYQLLPTDIEEVDITKIDEVTQFVHVNGWLLRIIITKRSRWCVTLPEIRVSCECIRMKKDGCMENMWRSTAAAVP